MVDDRAGLRGGEAFGGGSFNNEVTEMEDDILSQIGGPDVDAGEVEKKLASMGPIQPGFYRAKLNGAKGYESHNGSRAHELVFLIVGGPYDGREVTDKLWLPSAEKVNSTDDKDVKTVGNLRARIAKFGLVLGLFVKDAKGKLAKADPNKGDFIDVLDTECIVEVQLEPDQQNPDKKWPRIAFNGIFRKDDKDAAAKIGKGGGKGSSGAGGATPSGGSKPAPTKPAESAKKAISGKI